MHVDEHTEDYIGGMSLSFVLSNSVFFSQTCVRMMFRIALELCGWCPCPCVIYCEIENLNLYIILANKTKTNAG